MPKNSSEALPFYFRDWLPNDIRYRLSFRSVAIILVFGATLLLVSLGSRALTHHEVFFTQPAKEMVASGDWLVPRSVGVPVPHYPPGTHWAVAAAIAVSGSAEEAVVRLPSVLAGLATALIVAGLTARWFGGSLGLIAGLMQLTIYYVLQEARLAESDMLLIASVAAAMGCFALANVESPCGRVKSWWLPLAFYGLLGVAFLVKALIGVAFVLSACGLFAVVQFCWQMSGAAKTGAAAEPVGPQRPAVGWRGAAGAVKRWVGSVWNRLGPGLQFLLNPLSLIAFLTVALTWAVPAFAHNPRYLQAQLLQHLGRFSGELGANHGSFFYAYSVLLVTLPWTPVIAWGLYRLVRQGKFRDPIWVFLACWMLPGLILLQLSAFKAKHYLGPLMPPLTILGAVGLVDLLVLTKYQGLVSRVARGAAIVLGCGAAAVIVLQVGVNGAPVIVVLIGLLAVGLMAILTGELLGRLDAQLIAGFLTAWMLAAGTLCFIMPYYDSYRDRTELAYRVNRCKPPGAKLFLLGLPENQITYYLEPPLQRIDRPEDGLRELPRELREVYVLAPKHARGLLARLGQVEVLERCASVRRGMAEEQRLILYRLCPTADLARNVRDAQRSEHR